MLMSRMIISGKAASLLGGFLFALVTFASSGCSTSAFCYQDCGGPTDAGSDGSGGAAGSNIGSSGAAGTVIGNPDTGVMTGCGDIMTDAQNCGSCGHVC